MNAALSALCIAANWPVSPTINFQGSTLSAYTPDKTICPIDPDLDVIFHLYTQNNLNVSQIIKTDNDTSISSCHINFANPTIMFFHGYMETYESEEGQLLKDALLKKGPHNVIIVDQKRLLAGLNYMAAANNVKPIGEFSAKLVEFLIKKGLKIKDLIVVGHSLGSHTAHFLSKVVRLHKIIAQDPAGPRFQDIPVALRLSKDSADFVVAIHTNPGVNGYATDCGDVDIYVNGHNPLQPHCKPTSLVMNSLSMASLKEMASEGILNIPYLIFCSHRLSYEMTIISVNNPTAFPARKCDNYISYKAGKCDSNDLQYVGLYMDENASGRYYVETSSKYPYTMNKLCSA